MPAKTKMTSLVDVFVNADKPLPDCQLLTLFTMFTKTHVSMALVASYDNKGTLVAVYGYNDPLNRLMSMYNNEGWTSWRNVPIAGQID